MDCSHERINHTRERLRKWGAAHVAVRRKETEIAEAHSRVVEASQTLCAQALTGMPRSGQTSDPTFQAVVDLEERRKLYEMILAEGTEFILRQKAEIQAMDKLMREGLTDVQIDVLTLRYKENQPWESIRHKLKYSEQGVKKIELKAAAWLSFRLQSY